MLFRCNTVVLKTKWRPTWRSKKVNICDVSLVTSSYTIASLKIILYLLWLMKEIWICYVIALKNKMAAKMAAIESK